MHAVIRHYIKDSAKWDQAGKKIRSLIEQGSLPRGLKPLAYLPSADGCNADCVWEADSLELLQGFVDSETSGAARNEYFEVKVDEAMGLPQGEERAMAQTA